MNRYYNVSFPISGYNLSTGIYKRRTYITSAFDSLYLPVHLSVYISAADRDINKINVQDIHVELYDKNKTGRGKN